MVKLEGVVVIRSHVGLYSNLVCIVFVFVEQESWGSLETQRCSQKA
jgi:hypothetical protein